MTRSYEHYQPKNKWEQDVLNYNPYDGDFGEQDDRTFKDRLVIARKQYSCVYCNGTIAIGELHRYEVAKVDGSVGSCRHCKLCCDAMVSSWTDNGDEIIRRFQLNNKKNKEI